MFFFSLFCKDEKVGIFFLRKGRDAEIEKSKNILQNSFGGIFCCELVSNLKLFVLWARGNQK